MSVVQTTRIECFGVVIELRGSGITSEALAGYLPSMQPTTRSPSHVSYEIRERTHGKSTLGYEVWRTNGTLLSRARDHEEVVGKLANELHFEIASTSTDFVFVHAGVVSWSGRAIVLPGRSMSGKTTLVRALLEQGATYFSDEYAVLDPNGLVHPYARPLRVRSADGPTETRAVGDFTNLIGAEPVPLGLVAVLKFDPDTRLDLVPISPGAAALALLDNTVRVRDAPASSIRAATEAGQALGLGGTRGEASEAAVALLAQASEAFS